MKFYLRYINPSIAFVVLVLCIWAGATQSKADHMLSRVVEGGLNSYFFAKGLFCSATLFLTGISLLRRWESEASRPLYRPKDFAIVGVFVAAMIGGLFGLYLQSNEMPTENTKARTSQIAPKEIEVTDAATIPASQFLTISAKLTNSSAQTWESVELSTEVFLGKTFSGTLREEIKELGPHETRHFLLKSETLLTYKIQDSVHFQIQVKALPK